MGLFASFALLMAANLKAAGLQSTEPESCEMVRGAPCYRHLEPSFEHLEPYC